MVFRKLRCYVCDGRFAPRLMTRIDGDDNAAKREIAINRRDGFQRPALEVTDLTKICTNCNQSIRNEIVAIEEDPACLRLNVLTQTRNSTCLICDRTDNLNVLSIECKVNVFISHNIFIPQNTKSCQHHLNVEGMLLGPLVQDSEFQCLCPINKQQFAELFTFCDTVPCTGGYRYVHKKDLLMFLCKMRQGLSDEFLRIIFQYPSRRATSMAVATSYCVHKGRHLVKPVLIVAPDGYILDIQGPYFSDSRNNDAAILQNEADADRMLRWFQEDDIVIVDRGYRDAIDLLRRLGITWKMPALLPRNQCQLSTDEANESRLVTKQRWIVEARNGHLKLIFKFLQQTISMHHVPNLGDFCRIAGAIINRYHPTIEMEGADAEKAYEMLEKAKEPNIVQALVEVENLKTRNAQRWVPINDAQLVDFPMLDIEYLKMLTVGIYQIKLAPAYVQDNVQRNDDEQFHIDMLRDANRLPQPGLLRVRIYSRFRNAAKYQLWITYRPNDDNEVDDGMDGNMNEEVSPILGYYCTCKSGTRTLGTCAHISSILWYLGYARYQENIHYPSTRLIQTVADAGNRPLPRNDHMP
ncbi:hypothetical protein ALC62_03856 [Cyphomyrmex costatus]|uniref:DDE Tnp4 domain-containing protein n=1 Tax=Cyphomyrmex costatus TaxID=456900 RepID=A0A151ICL2_9HYME|nr:hypothetical protein ALC62_11491 [Cyphomyrmex costatus]KYN05252.1 hypothetical protein ALC62_03856 [Cyphomyrmex costatus]